MKRDTIFYQIFQQSPSLLFDLLPVPIVDKRGYIFDSVEVKETAFRIDGVLRGLRSNKIPVQWVRL
jgi:predicted transposase YdaD